MKLRLLFLMVVGALLLAGCNNDPVVVVATAVPLDANFRVYQHPTGVFSLRLPPNWSVRDVSQGSAIRVEFSPPDNEGLPMSVYVINTGAVMDTNELLNAIEQYQQVVNGDPTKYTEVSRNAQGDGSWRIAGFRHTPIGTRELNTFIQADKAYLTAIEIDLTNLNEAQRETLHTIVNTYRVNPNAVVNISSLQVAADNADSNTGALEFSGMYAWTNPQGIFIVNGLVKNTSLNPMEAIRVTALLFDAQDNVLVEQPEVIAVEILEPGLTTPFSIRFRGGKPSQTVRYELRGASRYAETAVKTYLNDDNFLRGNVEAKYNADGFLTVTGDVVNKTQGLARFVKVIVAVKNEQEQIVATESVFLSKPDLLPGETSKFEVVFYELGGQAARFELRIEGKSG
ncbi:MAG: DUF3426 domain-containing protein [Anaerolineae bacterium]|nr:DUF3426 domain-containing protein [Anaerolineae bacterium]